MLPRVRATDIELLRLFAAVAECGGFSAAQARLNMTQSTISTRMAKLEGRLGYRLCERGRAGFRLTAKGERVLTATRELFNALDAFSSEARSLAGRLVGDLRVGLADNIGGNPSAHVDSAIARFRDRAPDVTLHLVVADPDELERRVLSGELHMAASYTPTRLPTLEYHHLFDEPQAVHCGRRQSLFDRPDATIDESDLAAVNWVEARYALPGEPRWHAASTAAATADHVDAMLQLLLSGHFLGYLPVHYAAPWVARGDLRTIRETDLAYTIDFHAIRRRAHQHGEVETEFLRELLAAHGATLKDPEPARTTE